MIGGVLAVVTMAALVIGGNGTKARKAQDFPLPVIGAGGPARTGWTVMSAYRKGPAITYLVPLAGSSNVSIPSVVLMCRQISFSVTVRGFTPDNAWPQPPLTTGSGR